MATATVTKKPSGFGVWLEKLLAALPETVAGIEQVHGDTKNGATKKQLALESLGLALHVTEDIDPALDPAIVAATALVSNAIDGVKAVYNAVQGKKNAAPAVPLAPPPPGAGF